MLVTMMGSGQASRIHPCTYRKTVTEKSDGIIEKKEETKKTAPNP
ncbi:MAG TPA: hypothetical protein VK530_09460 [Candidatus Acidoferrum sp.]|nr:hypothetical protein [Candidatus Acidoferrum sp.]